MDLINVKSDTARQIAISNLKGNTTKRGMPMSQNSLQNDLIVLYEKTREKERKAIRGAAGSLLQKRGCDSHGASGALPEQGTCGIRREPLS